MIILVDIENIIDAGFTGLNTRAGDLLTVKFKYNLQMVGAIFDSRKANLMHIVLRSDHIMEIHDTRVKVFDWLMM